MGDICTNPIIRKREQYKSNQTKYDAATDKRYLASKNISLTNTFDNHDFDKNVCLESMQVVSYR